LRCYFSPLSKSTIRKDKKFDDPNFHIPEDVKPEQMVIGPKCGTLGAMVTLTLKDIRDIKSNIVPTLWGEARYNDIFPGTKQHVTKFCQHIVSVKWPKNLEDPAGRIEIMAQPCLTHNCMNDECGD
jgi:hypothetical protein